MKKLKKLNNLKTVIIGLVLLVVILLLLTNHLMKSTKTYMFSGKNDYVMVLDGVISFNYDVNLFQGSHIKYIHEEDFELTKYEIGYYVKVGNEFKPILIKKAETEEGFSLKLIIDEMSGFNLTETTQKKPRFKAEAIREHFTKEIKNNIENLYFIIEAETIDEEIISEKIELIIHKVSK